jgi:5-methylcytosine-specific restriction endonuclease McrA
MYRKVLLLNQNYQPLGIISWRRAVNLVIGREKAHTLVEYQIESNKTFDAAVVRLTVKSPDPFIRWERQKFSKRNIFLRDSFECQFCTKQLVLKDLTIDHVKPRAQGGKTHYLNCVTSCKRCNSRKGDRTPEEAGMKLNQPIRRPNMYDVFNTLDIPSEWRDYICSKKK